jgi:regulatory GntR family protein/aminotransferase class I and II
MLGRGLTTSAILARSTRPFSNARMKRRAGLVLPDIALPGPAPRSRRAALHGRIRSLVLAGRLKPGARLPSTRTLAGELGLSRTTAEEAYAQLVCEGWLERRVGDGTYVSADLPAPAAVRPSQAAGAPAPPLSRRGRALAAAPACLDPVGPAVAFRAGYPDPRLFPLEIWQRLHARRLRRGGRALLGYGDAAGLPALREALADHLAATRGVRCDADRIVVLSSSQQALDLCARLLVDPGDPVWLEDPGYPGARAAFELAGAELVPVDVDARGLDVAEGIRRAPAARLAYASRGPAARRRCWPSPHAAAARSRRRCGVAPGARARRGRAAALDVPGRRGRRGRARARLRGAAAGGDPRRGTAPGAGGGAEPQRLRRCQRARLGRGSRLVPLV